MNFNHHKMQIIHKKNLPGDFAFSPYINYSSGGGGGALTFIAQPILKQETPWFHQHF